MVEGFDAQKIVNHISLMYSCVVEHGTDVFRELVKTDPKRAIEELPQHMERVLGLGNGIFRGFMCGGPHEGVTAPMLDAIGSVYPCLERKLRENALENCLGFLDGLNYFVSQNNVELIDEPWLVGDILANRPLYYCGFCSYADKLEKVDNWFKFKEEFVKDGKFDVKSVFWLSYAVSYPKYCQKSIRDAFAEQYPELVDRTKDAIAGYIHGIGIAADTCSEPLSYEASVAGSLENYDPDWHSEIRAKIAENKFIILEKTISKIQWQREYEARKAAEKKE